MKAESWRTARQVLPNQRIRVVSYICTVVILGTAHEPRAPCCRLACCIWEHPSSCPSQVCVDNNFGDGGLGIAYNTWLPNPARTPCTHSTHLHRLFDALDLRLVFLCHRLALCDHSSVFTNLCAALTVEFLFNLRQMVKGGRHFLRLTCSGHNNVYINRTITRLI